MGSKVHSGALKRRGLRGGYVVLPLAALMAAGAAGAAESAVPREPHGVLTLSASATVEVPQDWMSLTFSVSRDGTDAANVQSALKQAVDAAMVEARKIAKPGEVEVRSGGFSVYPRHNSKGGITGWQGNTELVVEGRDMKSIGQLTGRIGTMAISGVRYSLSRQTREQAESEATGKAIARFRATAADYVKAFGFSGYTLREVNVSTEQNDHPVPVTYGMRAMEKADGDALAVEAGQGSVTATVSGSIQMQ